MTAALLSSRDISTAIGIMMASDKLTADDAFGRLRSVSQDDNRTLRDVALDVVHTGVLPAVTRPSRRPE